jgi:hypothetical protein
MKGTLPGLGHASDSSARWSIGSPPAAPTTRTPDPIWGAWVNDRWYVEGGSTRWKRNLRENPQLAINVEVGDEVVIVEGRAREVSDLDEAGVREVLAGYAKYKAIGYEAEASNWTGGGLWELEPVKAFAWSSFPEDMTRYTF